MKSLEIVNEEIEMRKGNILNDAEWNRLKKLETIKQDLEVLEIFNKLLGDMEIDIWKSKLYNKEIGEIKYSGTDFELDVEDRGVTVEELLKLKQWLEENENDKR